jgi:hypothetical protein
VADREDTKELADDPKLAELTRRLATLVTNGVEARK